MNLGMIVSIAGVVLLAGCDSDKRPATDASAQATSGTMNQQMASDSLMDKQMTSDGIMNQQRQMMVPDSVIEQQRQMLAQSAHGKNFGPQSPRDIDSFTGKNTVVFPVAPAYTSMNLCNIHFHKGAEHKGGQFTKYAGNGDGNGYHTGFLYSGNLTKAELAPVGDQEFCPSKKNGSLHPGDTIEAHYVFSSGQVEPGATLYACLDESTENLLVRVETQVYVLVNDVNASDFIELTKHDKVNGLHQALNIPNDTGTPVQYAGSTTGPQYNDEASPFQVTWNVRPEVVKVNIASVGKWCEGNAFDEDHAHGVRNLIINPELLSPIVP